MTALRVAALLLVMNAAVLVAGAFAGGGGPATEGPTWLPPLWLRSSILLVVAAGLWFGLRWAWWCGVVICSALVLWIGIASLLLGLGGYFTGEGAGFRAVHLGLLLGTVLGALALLVSGPGRRAQSPLHSIAG